MTIEFSWPTSETTAVEPRDRLLSPIAQATANDEKGATSVAVDFGALVRNMILCDRLIVQSVSLLEFPLLITKFGYDGVKALLESGRMRVLLDTMTIGDIGRFPARTNGPVLPLGSYSFSGLRLSAEALVSGQLQRINDVPGLSAKQAQKLRQLVGTRLTTLPEDAGRLSEDQLKRDLVAGGPSLKLSVATATRQHFGIEISPDGFDLRVHRINEWDWRTESNLGSRTGLDAEQTHQAIAHGLLAVGATSIRLEFMKIFDALTGFQQSDLPLFDEKYAFLVRQLDPEVHSARFVRVREIVGLPDVDPDPTVSDVDLARLLEITAGPEVQEFRRWLRGIESASDEELANMLHPVRDAVRKAVRSPTAKAVRFATTTGVGVVLPPVGILLSALDTFLVEKIIPGPGPTAFLSELFPSVFRDQ